MSTEDQPQPDLGTEERELGMSADITRRDFVNSVAMGTGAALLGAAAPAFRSQSSQTAKAESRWHPWTGYGGVGDYANSNGNTWDVVSAGHRIRDGSYERAMSSAIATGETYDVVIVGGGFAGIIAAYTFLKNTQRKRPCLLIDDHPVIGGEAKRNEFIVRGQRLIGPQGSNGADVPTSGWRGEMWRDIGFPTDFEFAQLKPDRKPMDFALENYEFLLWADNSDNHGYFFESPTPHWVTNPWARKLDGTPYSADLRRDLLRWREEPAQPFDGDGEALKRWLDTMTYEDYLTKYRKLSPDVARFADPVLASGAGLW